MTAPDAQGEDQVAAPSPHPAMTPTSEEDGMQTVEGSREPMVDRLRRAVENKHAFIAWTDEVPGLLALAEIGMGVAGAVAAERERCAALVEEFAGNYPRDIFIEPPPGKHGATVDGCSARAARTTCATLARMIRGVLPAPQREEK